VTRAIGLRLPDLLSDAESFEANRASTEASILGFAQILDQGADPAATSLGAATLAYTQEAAKRGISLTTLIRSYRLGHAAAWERTASLIARHSDDPEQRAIATQLCSAWLFAYVDAALCLAEDFYSAERERWVRSTAATRAETIERILAGDPIDASLASRRLGYELDRQHTAVIAWLEAHEEGRDTHAAMETAIGRVRDRLGSSRALVHPIGILSIAAWVGMRDSASSRALDDLRLDVQTSSGVRLAIGDPAPGLAGFRQSHTEAVHARRIAELAGRPPGTITRYSRVALAAIATADLEQARVFVQRELRGLAADDDLSTRLSATLRTYLDEHASRTRTAKRLGIHENTVSYRVRQAEEALGRSVDQRTLDLRVALALAHLVRDRAP
jgi:sugar diacid utilization regulator